MKAIETHKLTKRFGDQAAVNGLDLSVNQGELYALLGVNGAGKTTTIKMLSCLLLPTSGDGLVLGQSIVHAPQRVKELINLSPQESAVARNLTVRENLELIAALYGVPPKEAKARAAELQAAFQLEAGKKAKVLSGGMQRRLSIAMALITRPQILFLDEPTLGLDVLAKRALWSLVESLKGTMTIILTTHNMEEAQVLADEIGILCEGALKAQGTAKELMARTGSATLEDAFVALATGEEDVA